MSEESNRPDIREHRLRDIITVFILSITAVLTAWCGFESSKWGGAMSIAFSQASSARIQAANYEGQARDARQFDLTIYAQWGSATAARQPQVVEYIEERFTPAFVTAFQAWQDGGMQENSPFALDQYVPEGTKEASEWSATADARFDEALEHNQRADNYSLLTVLFALVLFLTAMSQRHISELTARILLGLGIVAGTTGVIIMFTFPVLI